jgi:uncharacterized protein
MEENVILQVLMEQREELLNYDVSGWVSRPEEGLFEWGSNMAQVVIGVRRSGKSTLCHNALMRQGVKYAYANLDDDRLLGMESSGLNTLLGCMYQIYGVDVNYLFFDEIQNVEGWHLFVNRLLRQGMHIVLTGSNAKLLSGELATHLTGRYNEIRLYPFSYLEFCNAENVDTKGITTKADAARKIALDSYLNDGGFPELMKLQNPRGRRTYIEGLIETIVTKDIVKRFKIRNPESIRRIAYHLINNACQIIDYGTLAEISSLKTAATAQKYASYLSQAFLIIPLQKFSYKSRERITGEKAYVVDQGFVSNRSNSLIGENLGWRLENAVLIELLRRHYSAAEDIYYYKPSTRQKEVDFVVCRQNIVQELVQVSYDISDAKTFRRETESLALAATKLKCDNLWLVCMGITRDVTVNGQTVHIVNAIEWLLNRSISPD